MPLAWEKLGDLLKMQSPGLNQLLLNPALEQRAWWVRALGPWASLCMRTYLPSQFLCAEIETGLLVVLHSELAKKHLNLL